MIVFFAVVGILTVIGVVLALTLYLLDAPAQTERLRIEREAQTAAWQIHERARDAFSQMLDVARDHPRDER
jgi:hypothetical protein